MAKQPLVHQLTLARLLLAAQSRRLGRDVRGHDGQHAVLHVLQHAAAQLRRQRLDEGDGVQGRVAGGGLLGELPPLLLRPLLGQDLQEDEGEGRGG